VSDDPRDRFLSALGRELRGGPLTRRRFLREIAAHLDDSVAELEAHGRSERAAVEEALRRLGDVSTITRAFREIRPNRRRRSRMRALRSPAWITVAAMSLVTAWAAELPPASGAKATTRALSSTHPRQLVPRHTEPIRPEDRLRRVRVRHPSRP
jgi:HAAS